MNVYSEDLSNTIMEAVECGLARRVYNEARVHEKHESSLDDLINSVETTITRTDEQKHQKALSKAKEMQVLEFPHWHGHLCLTRR